MKQLGRRQLCNICCFFFLVSLCVTGTLTLEVTLTQTPGSALELIDKEMEIKCEVKGATLDNLRICWYRETPWKGNLDFLVCITFGPKESYTYGNFSKSRLDLWKNTFPTSSVMKIKDLQQSDSGVYFCMAQMTKTLFFGTGTFLTVVETLPTTVPPTTRKPPCKCKKPKIAKPLPPGLSCSAVIWAPVAGFAVILIIGLYFLASHTYRVFRRTHMYFRKYSPK